MSTELTPIARAAVALGTAEREKSLIALAKESTELVKITNQAGRDQIHTARMKLKTTRVDLEKSGKAARDDAQAYSKAVIAEEKRLIGIIAPEEERLQVIQSEYDDRQERERQAKAEELRKKLEALQAGIAAMRAIPQAMVGKPSADIEAVITNLQKRVIEFGDLQGDAVAARDEALKTLSGMFLDAKAREDEAARQVAEAARLKADREKFEREQAEAKAKRDAEEAAHRERMAAEQKRVDDQAAQVRQQQEAVDRQRREQEEAAHRARLAKEESEARAKREEQERADALRRAAEEAEATRARQEREAAERAVAETRERERREYEERCAREDLVRQAAPALLAACLSMLKTCGSSQHWQGSTKASLLLIEGAIELATGQPAPIAEPSEEVEA
jgi:hypothetical protein